jgi:glycosyltransferase involved in cell wall biosynthesis
MRILFYGESPVVCTGLGHVSRCILDAIKESGDHQVEIVGINHHIISGYNKEYHPYDVVPVIEGDDPNVTKTIIERIRNSEYEMVFLSTDFGRDVTVINALIEERQKGRNFLIVGYYAVDCDIIPAGTFDSLTFSNVKIVYSNHAKSVIERLRPDIEGVNVVYLSCDTDTFHPVSPEERKRARREIFNITDDDHFLCISVNRNQARKDLGRLLAIFHEFHKTHTKSTLYVHAQRKDLGGDLMSAAHSLGMSSKLEEPEIIFSGENFHPLQGYSKEWLNMAYNAADCLLSTSTGEGWGLSTTDAMAAGCPVVVPNNTAFTEIVGANEERGYLIKSGGDIDHRIVLYGLTDNPRNIVWSASALAKLEEVYQNKGTKIAADKARDAREWTLTYNKEKQHAKWKAFFCDINKSINELKERSISNG